MPRSLLRGSLLKFILVAIGLEWLLNKMAWFKKHISGAAKPHECIQGLWIGDSLSAMEAASIQSYLNHGHDFHLYTYGDVGNVPAGAIIYDANEIVDQSRIFKYADFDSYAGFANLFRYTLLFKKGGYWSDLDIFCLRPLTFTGRYLFAGDPLRLGWKRRLKNILGSHINVCFMKAPAGNEFCREAIEYCQAQDVKKLQWGQTGPDLCTRLVPQMGLKRYVAPIPAFCAIPSINWADFISEDPRVQSRRWRELSSKRVFAVHLWHEMWRRSGVDKTPSFHPDCLYERLKRVIMASST